MNGKLSNRPRGRRPELPNPLDSSPLIEWSGFLLYRVTEIARELYNHRCKELNFTPAQVGILQILRGSGAMIQGVIAESVGVSAASMSAMTDDLVARGHIDRLSHEEDGRVCLLRIAPQGLQQMRQFDTLNRKADDDLFAALNNEERATLRDLLNKIYDDHSSSALRKRSKTGDDLQSAQRGQTAN